MVGFFRVGGGLLLLLGIAFDRRILERWVLYDGTVESGPTVWAILVIRLGLIASGLWLIARARRLGLPSPANLLLLAFSSLLGLALCEAAFRLLDPDYVPARRAWVGQHENRESVNFVADPLTGWRMRSDRSFEWTFDGRVTRYRSNAQGFRAEREFDPTRRPIIALAGDSFTWGTGVEYAETFGARLERRLADVEVRNLAMPGFGVDQMWMSVRHQALPMPPDLVVVTFIDDDFARSLTAYRPGEGFNKPKFVLRRGVLVPETADAAPGAIGRFLRSNLKLWAPLDYRIQRLRPFGDWWELNLAMLEEIATDCAASAVPALFVRVPVKRQGGFAVLGRELTARGLAFIDVGERIGTPAEDFYLETDDHPSPAGHERLASILEEWIRGARLARISSAAD